MTNSMTRRILMGLFATIIVLTAYFTTRTNPYLLDRAVNTPASSLTDATSIGSYLQHLMGDHFEVIFDPRTGIYSIEPKDDEAFALEALKA